MLLVQSKHNSVLALLISEMPKLLGGHHHSALHGPGILPVRKLRDHRIALWASSHHSGQANFRHTKAALLSQMPFGVVLSKSMGRSCTTIGGVGVKCGTVLE